MTTAVALAAGVAAWAQPAATPVPASPPATEASAPAAPPYRSALDLQLMYQLLVAEISVREGDPGTGYQLVLDAARRTKDDSLFRRSVDIALRAQAGEQALAAARAWRTAQPGSRDANELTAQILLALNRPAESVEPLRAVVSLTPPAERSRVIAAIPGTLGRLQDKKLAATLVDDVVQPFRSAPATAAAALAASGRASMSAGDLPRALQSATEALATDPANEPAALLAVDLMGSRPEAEDGVKRYLQAGEPTIAVRLAYARRLAEKARMAEAATQLEAITRRTPGFAGAWLSLGAARLELKQFDAAEAALKTFLKLRTAPRGQAADDAATASPAAPAAADADAAAGADDDAQSLVMVSAASDPANDQQLIQAYLLLSQIAEERGQYAAAQSWLEKIPSGSTRELTVQMRRASLLARQGKLDQARAAIRKTPATTQEEARAKLMAEGYLLRDASRWKDAYTVFSDAAKRYPDDTELIYQQAMVAEKLGAYEDMERQLRRVIELDPDHYNAYNALGFSLADRNQRLPEAKKLIERALELSANDPYIIDSLGWVEFRLGNLPEARRLLAQAFEARPDAEIAAHLGEVMWAQGERDEARRVLRDAKRRDASNTTLGDTIKRLKISL